MSMIQRPSYEKLPFTEQEGRRSYEDVQAQHSFGFLYAVEKVIDANGTCRVLDLGCGNSTFGFEIAAHCPEAEVFTVDIYSDEERGYDRTDDPSNLHFVQADGERFPFRDDTFDIIVTTWGPGSYALGDKRTDESYITEIGRALAPGGMAFSRPESKLFAFPLDTIIERDNFPDHLKAKAQHFKLLTEAGFRLFFDDDPNRLKIVAPKIKTPQN